MGDAANAVKGSSLLVPHSYVAARAEGSTSVEPPCTWARASTASAVAANAAGHDGTPAASPRRPCQKGAIEAPRAATTPTATHRARGAAAVYYNDLFVPLEHSMETADLLPGVHTRITSEHEHSGLRTGNVLAGLFDLADGRSVR